MVALVQQWGNQITDDGSWMANTGCPVCLATINRGIPNVTIGVTQFIQFYTVLVFFAWNVLSEHETTMPKNHWFVNWNVFVACINILNLTTKNVTNPSQFEKVCHQSCNESTFSRVRVESESCMSRVESSPSLTWQDSSLSPAGFESESESRCPWLGSESESQGAEFLGSITSNLP